MRALKSSDGVTAEHVLARQRVTDLARFYMDRSSRQQRILDVASSVVVIGAIGAAASGNVSTNTQNNWIYGALTPVVLAQFNANEPTRDLFFAGSLGMNLVTQRYDHLVGAAKRLKDRHKGFEARTSQGCTDARAAVTAANRLQAERADRAVIFPEAQRVMDQCHALEGAHAQLDLVVAAINAGQADWPASYARDALALDAALLTKDRDLRFTPIETVSAILASPFRAIDTLISGTDAQAALKKLETQEAFEGLDLTLAPVALPVPPAELNTPLRVSDAARARGAASSDAAHVLTTLEKAVRGLETERLSLAQNIGVAKEQQLAAQVTNLDFDYNAISRRVTVSLNQPAPPPTALAENPAPTR